jgi:hypothetical protein
MPAGQGSIGEEVGAKGSMAGCDIPLWAGARSCGGTLDIGQMQCSGHTPGPAPRSSANAAAVAARPAAPGGAAAVAWPAAPASAAATSESDREGALRRTPVGAVYCRPPPMQSGSAAKQAKRSGKSAGGESESGELQRFSSACAGRGRALV